MPSYKGSNTKEYYFSRSYLFKVNYDKTKEICSSPWDIADFGLDFENKTITDIQNIIRGQLVKKVKYFLDKFFEIKSTVKILFVHLLYIQCK